MKYLSEITDKFFLYSLDVLCMYIAVSVVYLHRITNFVITVENVIYIFVANSLGVFGIYLLNKLTDTQEDNFNGHSRYSLKKNNLTTYIILGCLFSISTLLYLATNKSDVIFYGILLFIVSTLYSFPKRYRLKKIFLVKNFIPAFCWSFSLAVMILAGTNNLSMIFIMKALMSLFILEFIFEIIWDIPDRKGDALAGIKTIPNTLSFLEVQLLLVGILSSFFFYTNSIPNKIVCLLFCLFIILISEKTKKKTYHYFLFSLTIITCFTYFLTRLP